MNIHQGKQLGKSELFTILLILHSFSVNQVLSLMCLSCHASIQPRHCHSISYCADDEVCFVERVESVYGVRFNTGCLQRPVCEEQNKTLHIHGNSDGNLGPPTCTECCDTDLCNAKGCGQPGYPRLSERGPVCLACSQLFDNQECRQITHCRDSELCFIKEESEFGDKVYSSGCMPFQQCISIVSNTHAVTDLSNMHHYTYSTTPKLMTNTGTSRVMTSTKTPTSSPTSMPSTLTYKTTNLILTTKQSPPPTHTTKLPKPTHTTNPPTSSRTTTPLTSGTHASTTTELFGIPVVGKRGDRRKRFTSCEHCCRGDLCNNVCVHHSKITPTPHYFTSTP
nr:uncharacterized protein LOC111133121 isoform X2 [Crassostrea virginica]